MNSLFIVGVVILIVIVLIIGREKQKRNALFYSTKSRIKKDIKYYTVLGDWRKLQELKLQNLWIDSVEELTIDNLKYPLSFDSNNIEHIDFATRIILCFKEKYDNNTEQRLYKPDNSLPIAKSSILKSLDFFNKLYESDKLEESEEMHRILLFVFLAEDLLNDFYLDTGDEDLPQDKSENYMASSKYLTK